MRVVHVPFCFHPDPVGGTEVYVEALARELRPLGVESVVAAPARRDDTYRHGDTPVHRFETADDLHDLELLYGAGDPVAAQAFGRVLDEVRPDLVHLHALSPAISLRLLREVRRRRIRVVFTYHTPAVSCQRGTLMRWGSERCDGRLDAGRCAQCTLHSRGMPKPLAIATERASRMIAGPLNASARSGGVWTALRMHELLELRHDTLRLLLSEVDHVVAVCDWVRRLLQESGVPHDRISLSRQGLSQIGAADRGAAEGRSAELRVAFLGRLEPAKGVHVLIEALRQDPSLQVSLDIFGVVQGEAGGTYLRRLQDLAASDPRINFLGRLPSGEVLERLRDYDLVAVPSQGLETGPLVVLEAFAAGTPVLGSALGGVAELVEDGVTGLLLPPARPAAWAEALRRLARSPEALERLRSAIQPPRTMATVAGETARLYQYVLGRESVVTELHPSPTFS